jgi:hypothetical protein
VVAIEDRVELSHEDLAQDERIVAERHLLEFGRAHVLMLHVRVVNVFVVRNMFTILLKEVVDGLAIGHFWTECI